MEGDSRVVALIDMDCFFCQVEEKLDPSLKGKPVAVVQFRGGVIAVNYTARALGVTRHMSGDEAKKICPDIQLPSVPGERGKADTMRYRDAGKEVALVLQKFTPLLERASVDEAYLDITDAVKQRLKSVDMNSVNNGMLANTYALGYDHIEEFISEVKYENTGDHLEFDEVHTRNLLIGALVINEIRKAVYDETGYECSAGIAHNKILAKLVCGMNKPNKQTILPKHSLDLLYSSLHVKKVKNLGGKFGDAVCDALNITTMGELQRFSLRKLQQIFDEKNGCWLYNIARGIDTEPVLPRFNSKSIGCCKQFPGNGALTELNTLINWLNELAEEIWVRLEKDTLENNRTPKQMVASFTLQLPGNKEVSSSKSYNFSSQDVLSKEFLASKTLLLIQDKCELTHKDVSTENEESKANVQLKYPIKFLSISVGKFEDNTVKNVKKIQDYFAVGAARTLRRNTNKHVDNTDCDTKHLKENIHLKKSKGIAEFFSVGARAKINTNTILHENLNIAAGSSLDDVYGGSISEYLEQNVKQDNITKRNSTVTSPLDEQEHFFQRFNNVTHNEREYVEATGSRSPTETTISACTEDEHHVYDSDSNYSASTIEMEINKSRSLLDISPDAPKRIESMRKLLDTTDVTHTKDNRDNESPDLDNVGIECEPSTRVEEINNEPEQLLYEDFSSNLMICPECGKELRESVYTTHTDYHLAVKLRLEERAASQIASNVISSPIPANSNAKTQQGLKTPVLVKTVTGNMSIKNFFSKAKIMDENVLTETCSECNKKVPLETFSEHLDFHEAKKLYREINNIQPLKAPSSVSDVAHTSKAVAVVKGGKRKRFSRSPNKKERKISKSIDTFFKL